MTTRSRGYNGRRTAERNRTWEGLIPQEAVMCRRSSISSSMGHGVHRRAQFMARTQFAAPIWLCSNCIVRTPDDPCSQGPDAANRGRPERMKLERYLAERASEQGIRHSLSNALRPPMGPATRLRAKQLATTAMAPYTDVGHAPCTVRAPVRLHLGSGGNNLVGWMNMGLVGADADLAWDLRRPLPFPLRSAEAFAWSMSWST